MDFVIIENDRLFQEVMDLLLKEDGHLTECLPWDERTLDRINARAFDAVIIDVDTCPDGFKAVSKIQRARPSAPLVLLVAELNDDTVREAARMGIWEILEKPFRREDLRLVTERLRAQTELSRQRQKRDQEATREVPPVAARLVIEVSAADSLAPAGAMKNRGERRLQDNPKR